MQETLPTDSPVDALQNLRMRRSMTKAMPDAVDQTMIESIIEAATWAPNHRKTCPWRFVVLRGAARNRLGDAMAQALVRRTTSAGGDLDQERVEKERAKPLRAPVLITVAAVPDTDPRTIEIEEIEATAAGVMSMLLAAQALGLGAMWRTGDAAYDPEIVRFLGLPETAHIVAFVYIGYPDIVPPLRRDPVDPGMVDWWDE